MFEIMGKQYELDGFAERFDKVCEVFNITLDGNEEATDYTFSQGKKEIHSHSLRVKITAIFAKRQPGI